MSDSDSSNSYSDASSLIQVGDSDVCITSQRHSAAIALLSLGSDTDIESPKMIPPSELKDLDPAVAKLILEQQARAAELEHELKLKELEASQERERQHTEVRRMELELEKVRLDAANQPTPRQQSSGHDDCKGPKVPKFREGDDIDVYLRTFEKLATVHEWKRETWATRLAAVLAGKALDAYSKLLAVESVDFGVVKQAIMNRYELTGESYRKKFRGICRKGEETFKELSVRAESYLGHWIDAEEVDGGFENLQKLLVMEQLLESCAPELQAWLRERKPKTIEELVELADHYVVTHKKPQSKSDNGHKPFQGHKANKFEKKRDSNGAKQAPEGDSKGTKASSKSHASKPKGDIRCFSCLNWGTLRLDVLTRQQVVERTPLRKALQDCALPDTESGHAVQVASLTTT